MSNSAQVRTALNVFLQRKSSNRVINTLFNAMPTLQMMLMLADGDKAGPVGLGRQKTNVMFGAMSGLSKAQQVKIFAEREYLPIVQTTKPSKSEVKPMDDYDSDPTVPSFDSTNSTLGRFTQPRFKFARKKMPYKVAHSEVRTAKNSPYTEGVAAGAIQSVYDVEVKTRTGVLCEVLNDDLWGINGVQGYPTSEDAKQWDHYHSIKNALKTDNTYGGLDRTVAANAFWQGHYDGNTYTDTFEDAINYHNYDLGFLAKGLGVQCIAVGAALMKKAKAEAKTESYQLISDGIKDMGEWGFKKEVVKIWAGDRPTYVYFDPAVPAGEAAFLDPSTWTFAIPGDRNFKVSPPSDQTKVEGGDEADTGTIEVEILLCCEVPSGNGYRTAWT